MIKKLLIKNQNIIEKNLNECFDKSQDITKYLTNLIIRLTGKKYFIKKEVRLKDYRGKIYRSGVIDLRIHLENKNLDIEIDRGNKLNSIEKLNYSKKILGNDVLWIKWGLQINEKILRKIKEYNIDYIYFHTNAHRIGRLKRRK
ncbi:hypothetical protein N9U27_00970 [Candidatus Pelagibacter sp.]|nr:hypothetical protein [Candidatus Pelagibacter sp.]